MTTPAGWYTDPQNPQEERLWDVSSWTASTRPRLPAPSYIPPDHDAKEQALSLVVPVGENGLVITVGYLGLLSLIIPPLGPITLWLAFRARKRKKSYSGPLRIISGFFGGAIGTVASILIVIAVVGGFGS